MKKSVQYFTKEYIEHCKKLSPDQILEFLESYRNLFCDAEAHRYDYQNPTLFLNDVTA